MKNSDSKEQSSKVYIPKGTKDKESPCDHSKPMGTAHPNIKLTENRHHRF